MVQLTGETPAPEIPRPRHLRGTRALLARSPAPCASQGPCNQTRPAVLCPELDVALQFRSGDFRAVWWESPHL